MKVKHLKIVNHTTVRDAVGAMLHHRSGQWWNARQMQAFLYQIGAKVSEEYAAGVMEDIYDEARDIPFIVYEKRTEHKVRYMCQTMFDRASSN
jgi:hypothetical protein